MSFIFHDEKLLQNRVISFNRVSDNSKTKTQTGIGTGYKKIR
jgi:hypothetical protein